MTTTGHRRTARRRSGRSLVTAEVRRRRAQVGLRDDKLPGMLWVGDADGGRSSFNKQWLTFTGRLEPQERGRGWLKGLSPADRRRYLEELRAAGREGCPLRTRYGLRRFDGTTRLVLEEARPRLNAAGQVVGFIGICLDSDDEATPERASAQTDSMRSVSGRLEAAREEERSRLARELHDELGQMLTSTKLDLMWLCERVRHGSARPTVPLVNKLQSLAGLVEVAIATVQRITTDLRPAMLDHFGLEAALEWEATKFQARTGIRCRMESRLKIAVNLAAPRATALFRIAQESLTNVARHAHAGAVRISLRGSRGRIVIEVQDNGRGIEERDINSPRAAGLLGMRERAHLLGGHFRISGTPGRGTRVVVSIPIRALDA